MKLTEKEIRQHVLAGYKHSLGKDYNDIATYVRMRKPPPYQFTHEEDKAFGKVMWELALQGVLVPTERGVHGLLGGARLTEYGRECITQEQTLPHDIDGYVANLRASMDEAPDEMLLQYAEEALECFQRDNLRAAVVMLGVAAERSLEILKNAYIKSLDEENREKAESKLKERMLRKRFDNLWRRIHVNTIPEGLQDRMEGDFWGAFQLIRKSRNEAGHFTAVETDKLTALACLASFPGYVRTLFQLVEYMGKPV